MRRKLAVRLSGGAMILQAQCGGIHLQPLGDLVELHLLAEASLRRAVPALGPARRLVGEHPATTEAVRRDVIGDGLQRTGIKGARHAVRSVGPSVEQRLQVHSGDLSVLRHPGAEAHQHRVPAAMAIEHFLARQADLHRAVQQQRRLRHDDFVIERIALAAEAATVGRGNHADVRRRQLQRLGERAMQIVRCLRAGPDDQLAVGILRRQRRVLLDRQVRAPLEEEHIVEHVVGAADGGIHVAELQGNRLVDVADVAVVVDAGLGVREAVVGAGVGAQRFVLHLDQVHGVGRRRLVTRDHGRHRVADEAHRLAAQRVLVVADRQHAIGDWKRLAGQYQVHARVRFGLRDVDANDARVRDR